MKGITIWAFALSLLSVFLLSLLEKRPDVAVIYPASILLG